jgi:hypothetical protein
MQLVLQHGHIEYNYFHSPEGYWEWHMTVLSECCEVQADIFINNAESQVETCCKFVFSI